MLDDDTDDARINTPLVTRIYSPNICSPSELTVHTEGEICGKVYGYGTHNFCHDQTIGNIEDLFKAKPFEPLRFAFTETLSSEPRTTLRKNMDGGVTHNSGAPCSYTQFVLLFATNTTFRITYA